MRGNECANPKAGSGLDRNSGSILDFDRRVGLARVCGDHLVRRSDDRLVEILGVAPHMGLAGVGGRRRLRRYSPPPFRRILASYASAGGHRMARTGERMPDTVAEAASRDHEETMS